MFHTSKIYRKSQQKGPDKRKNIENRPSFCGRSGKVRRFIAY